MKIELYYVVRPYKGSLDTIGRSTDAAVIAGPFPSFTEAWDVKEDKAISDSLEIVSQIIEVE